MREATRKSLSGPRRYSGQWRTANRNSAASRADHLRRSGDLTRRKLFPSLYRLYKNKMLAENFLILGTSRIQFTSERFRAIMHDTVKEAFPLDFDQKIWDEFENHIYYSTFDYADLASYTVDLVDSAAPSGSQTPDQGQQDLLSRDPAPGVRSSDP